MDAGCYDGGNPGILGDITGAVGRVVVVGAGIAGLATANALTHAGVECVVLEARDRAGGRLHTVDVAGWPVDMGGSWIHSPGGNPLSVVADQAGIRRRPGDPLGELVAFDCAERRQLTAGEWSDSLALQYEAFPDAQQTLLKQLGAGASMADAIDAFPAPTEIAVSAWGNDPWSGGAYSHIRPGGSAADADTLGTPVAGRLCFAGEHTQSERLVYAAGAFCSGIREAKRLLRSPTVQLRFSPPSRSAAWPCRGGERDAG